MTAFWNSTWFCSSVFSPACATVHFLRPLPRGHIQEKAQYRDAFERLRGLKTEIEQRQRIAAQDRARHRADFGRWLAVMRRQAGLPAPMEAELSSEAAVPDRSGHSASTERGHSSGSMPAAADPTAVCLTDHSEKGPDRQTAASIDAAGRSTQTAGRYVTAGLQRPVLAAGELPSQTTPPGSSSEAAQAGQEPQAENINGDIDTAGDAAPQSRNRSQDEARTNASQTAADDWKGAQANSAPSSITSITPRGAHEPAQPAEALWDVDPEVLAAAQPMLTGNAAADRSIIQFYEARAALLRSQAFRRTL